MLLALQSSISLMSILKLKNSDYLHLIFFIVNDNNASLLDSIINKSYMQVMVV